jgi:hypothetical protein
MAMPRVGSMNVPPFPELVCPRVPPLSVTRPVLPSRVEESMLTMPPVTVTGPVRVEVLTPLSVRMPAPSFVSVPL